LGVLFFVVFYTLYRTIALAALGFFVAEVLVLAISRIGIFSRPPWANNSGSRSRYD